MEGFKLLTPSTAVDARGFQRRLREGLVVTAPRVRLAHPNQKGRFYQHGWHSWSPARWVRLDATPHRVDVPDRRLQAWDPGLDDRRYHTGHWVGCLELPDGTAVVLGALAPDAHVGASPTRLWGRADRTIEWYLKHGPPTRVLEDYADHLRRRLGRRRDDPGNVWCTWYSLGRDITAHQVRELLHQLSDWPIDVVVVDDGWARAVGDWEPNLRFRDGMADLATRIRDAGRRPGLWLAPLIASEWSDLVAVHPEWLVSDDDGAPVIAGHNWGGRYYGLDVTHPEVRDHLVDLMRRVTLDWGWTYLKLDFLYGAAVPGRRRQGLGREQAYRSGIELIRDAVGDSVHLNACGAPIVPSIGVFDSLRIGPDVHPTWDNHFNASYIFDYAAPGTRNAISTSVARLWLSNVIMLDPDVVYFRSRYNLLRPAQRRMLADLAHVTGFHATSDPPDWLDGEEQDEMRAFFESRPAVRRVDWHRFHVGGRIVDFSAASLDHPRADCDPTGAKRSEDERPSLPGQGSPRSRPA